MCLCMDHLHIEGNYTEAFDKNYFTLHFFIKQFTITDKISRKKSKKTVCSLIVLSGDSTQQPTSNPSIFHDPYVGVHVFVCICVSVLDRHNLEESQWHLHNPGEHSLVVGDSPWSMKPKTVKWNGNWPSHSLVSLVHTAFFKAKMLLSLLLSHKYISSSCLHLNLLSCNFVPLTISSDTEFQQSCLLFWQSWLLLTVATLKLL